MTTPFTTKILGAQPDAAAPDGSEVRLLPALKGGGMAHFQVPAGGVTRAVTHRTVEEIWYVVAGRGKLWRRDATQTLVVDLAPGVAATIPLGTAFQFRAGDDGPLGIVGVTMPPWPGADEAQAVEGPWTPTLPASR
jgi:mannose-6-phosphate isomerase-like protein (cupin superfamily)